MTDVDNHARGAPHMAVEKDCPTILSVLLEHGADPDQMDENGCNRKRCALFTRCTYTLCTCMGTAILTYMYMYYTRIRAGAIYFEVVGATVYMNN